MDDLMSRLDQLSAALDAGDFARVAVHGVISMTRKVTPVETGHLRNNIRMLGVGGGQSEASATYGTRGIIYAMLQDQGGVVHPRGPWPMINRLTHQVIGYSATIPGSMYMAKGAESGDAEATSRMQALLNRIMNG
jgi:hypothetical protein